MLYCTNNTFRNTVFQVSVDVPLTSIIRTGLPIVVELIELVNSVIIFLSQMTLARRSTFLQGLQTVILIDLLSCTMAFPPLGNSDHVAVSVCIDLPSNSQLDAPFYRKAQADWGGLHDHLRDVPWEGIFKLVPSAAAREFCECFQVGIDVYIPHRKYQLQPHSSPWFSAVCAAAVAHRNHFFHLY